MVTKTRSTLTRVKSSSDDVTVILDMIQGKIFYIDDEGDYTEMSPSEYDQVKDQVITVKVDYATV